MSEKEKGESFLFSRGREQRQAARKNGEFKVEYDKKKWWIGSRRTDPQGLRFVCPAEMLSCRLRNQTHLGRSVTWLDFTETKWAAMWDDRRETVLFGTRSSCTCAVNEKGWRLQKSAGRSNWNMIFWRSYQVLCVKCPLYCDGVHAQKPRI